MGLGVLEDRVLEHVPGLSTDFQLRYIAVLTSPRDNKIF
jgi:hypothetical protein